MEIHFSRSGACGVLHYFTPLGTILFFISAKVVAACLLHKSSKTARATLPRYFAAALLIAVASTTVIQGLLYLIKATQYGMRAPPSDAIIYVLISFFVYVSLSLGLLNKKRHVWYPYLGAWVTALALEGTCTALHISFERPKDKFAAVQTVLQAIRVVLLLILSVFGSCIAFIDQRSVSPENYHAETRPLLPPDYYSKRQGGQEDRMRESFGEWRGIDASDDDDDIGTDFENSEADREVKEHRKRRLEESGNWLAYLRGFQVFVPMLWPSQDRSVKVCLMIVGLTIVAERCLNILAPHQVGIFIDELGRHAGLEVIPWRAFGLWILLLWLKSPAGLGFVKSVAELPVQQFAFRRIGNGTFKHIVSLSMEFHANKNSGELIRIIEQGQNLQNLLEFMFLEVGPMFIDLFVALVYMFTLFDIYMSVLLATVGLSYVWMGAVTSKWSTKRRRRFNAAWQEEAKVQNEAISNWQTVSLFNRETYECDRYSKSIDEVACAEWSYNLACFIGVSSQSFVILLGRLAATTLAAYQVAQGRASVGSFVTLNLYWTSIESPLGQVSWSIRRVTQMLTDGERLRQLMLRRPAVYDRSDAQKIIITRGEVVFDNVRFAYDGRRQILKNVSFKAFPGQTIALVGETGGGKSTILKLLYRYYDVQSGSISIDGQNIQMVTLDSLRASFGVVPQDPSLFNMSLMENLRYARLDATDEEVQEACKAAAIHDKIESFPDKYKTIVGERGVKLSGGELQRVSIARAILRQPKIVLLDEATSMIDMETESLIQEALGKLMAGRTAFVIAHRLSTIQHAHLILVINDGEIVEHGTHDELMSKKGKYFSLWSKQLGKNKKCQMLTINEDVSLTASDKSD
ncbi:hypothetical protein M433DRAFT_73019 [Acidomyces richmondensis BFW]|nr:hypothetical protein M433DRAFT_73019 [Acidomyces richmondensis BFW]